ncbi:hypothetical protein CALVIDRAFT_307543 [Calocera viscosa TUFC12733]|uniref:Protein kinase domain-containing protein n=1 Tax=Calocera viscosa (strain TUFC12733) TaxID=1330018 RepID=A0A167IC82_CALVF|nr:hypothetical protein CALVIDRAFT_307543 [Calocera viscosa TUFC12733]
MEVAMQDDIATTSTAFNGNARWLAFERLLPASYGFRQSETKSTMSDIFEMMRTFFEILTGGSPFRGKTDYEAMADVFRGANPDRPTIPCEDLDDERWRLMLDCWSPAREKRPSLTAVKQDLVTSMCLAQSLTLKDFGYVELSVLLHEGVSARRLLSKPIPVISLSFSTMKAEMWDELLQSIPLRQLHIRTVRFTDHDWRTNQHLDAFLEMTPSLHSLVLDGNRSHSDRSGGISSAGFIETVKKHVPKLDTLVIRWLSIDFGLKLPWNLRNLEIRDDIGLLGDVNLLHLSQLCELLHCLPALERLVLSDCDTMGFSRLPQEGVSDIEEAASLWSAIQLSAPTLSRLRVLRITSGIAVMAHLWMRLLSSANLRIFSISLERGKSHTFYWQIGNYWPELKALSMHAVDEQDMVSFAMFERLTALKVLEWDRGNFLNQVALARDVTSLLPNLKTLTIRTLGKIRPVGPTVVDFIQARASSGIPLGRLLVSDAFGYSSLLQIEPELRGIDVEIGWCKHRTGLEGLKYLDPEWELAYELSDDPNHAECEWELFAQVAYDNPAHRVERKRKRSEGWAVVMANTRRVRTHV